MITINGIELPNLIMGEEEMHRSLRISASYLKELERYGLPYIQADESHVYDPVEVWKWYTEYRRTKHCVSEQK